MCTVYIKWELIVEDVFDYISETCAVCQLSWRSTGSATGYVLPALFLASRNIPGQNHIIASLTAIQVQIWTRLGASKMQQRTQYSKLRIVNTSNVFLWLINQQWLTMSCLGGSSTTSCPGGCTNASLHAGCNMQNKNSSKQVAIQKITWTRPSLPRDAICRTMCGTRNVVLQIVRNDRKPKLIFGYKLCTDKAWPMAHGRSPMARVKAAMQTRREGWMV